MRLQNQMHNPGTPMSTPQESEAVSFALALEKPSDQRADFLNAGYAGAPFRGV
jgi:hypothetical protein